jgi:predicted RecB family nuclease
MRNLSKSKLLAWRQCPKRLWLELHQSDLREDSSATQASFATGHQVGDVARQIYDPQGQGQLIDPQAEGFDAAFARTKSLLATRQPIFEAGFRTAGALAFADVLLPTTAATGAGAGAGADAATGAGWRMVEVKSATSVKDYHRDDAAIQALVARESGVPLTAIALAHIDSGMDLPRTGRLPRAAGGTRPERRGLFPRR